MTTCLLVAAAVGPCATHAVAAVRAWRGTSDAVWTNANNWDTSSAPGTGDTAKFVDAGGAVDIISLGAGVTVNTISFETASAAAYTIGSGTVGSQTLTLNNGGAITVNSAVIQQEVFNANIVLGTDGTASNFTITNNRAGVTAGPYLQFSNGTTFTGSTGSGLKTLIFEANGTAATNSISALGNISNGTSGTVKLVKKGEGIMSLGTSATTMSYTGGTYLDAGTLQIVGVVGNLQTGTSLYIAGGTNLNCINQASGSYSNIVQQWNGDFSFNDSSRYVGATLQNMTFTGGTVDLGATGTDTVRTVNALANTFTVGGVISNGTNTTTTGLTKTGAGTMVLGGINTYTGTTTVNAGGLTINGVPTGGGAYATLGSGTLTISGTTGSLINSSAVTIAGGNLTLTNTTTAEGSVNRLNNATAITSNGGALTYANTTGNTYAENVGNVTLNGGQLNTVLSTNMATGIQTLTFNGLTQNNRSTATFSANTTTPNATTNIIKVAGATATPAGQIIGPWATTGTSAAVQTDYAVHDAAGNIVAANIAGSLDSTWTDSTKAYTSNFLGGGSANALSAVTHNMAALRNLPAFGNVATATTIAIPTGGNLNTYGLLNANASTWTINQVTGSTGALSTPTGGGSIYINTGNGTATGNGFITIGAPINDNGGAVSIVKTGTGFSVAVGQGVLTLSNVTSNYSGATVINGGAIVLNTSNALADINVASSLGKGSSGGSAADLVLNGGFLQYGTATTAVSTNRLFSIGAMGGTIDSSGATTATMSFVGTGAMGFASQTGPRTLTLQGSNVGVAASTSGSNTSQSTLALLIGDNSGATSLNKAGAGTWALTNSASTYTGPTTISGGILNVGTFAAANTVSSLGKGSATTLVTDLVLNGGTLQYSNNAAATTDRLFSLGASSGTIDSSAASPSNTLSFTATDAIGANGQAGARTLTLTGTNTGTNSMALRLDDLGSVGAGAPLLTNLTKSSTGTWALANAGNTYTGVTTINSGILSVSKLANGGVASSIGASSNLPANLLMTAENATFTHQNLGSLLSLVQPATSISLATVAPTLKYTGTGDSTDRTIKFTISSNDRAAVIDASGTGALNFTNANFTINSTASFSTAARRLALVLTGGNSADYTLANTISGIITDNGSEPISIVKTGLGTWVLAGNNSYGTISANGFGTTVNQGTLVLSGSPTGTVKTTVNAGGTLKLDYSTNNTSKLADATGFLQLGGGTLNLSGGSHTEVVTNTTLSPGASSVIQSGGGSSILRMNAITRNPGAMLDFGAASIADTDNNNAASVGILGAYATVAGANWAKSVDAAAANTAITAYTSGYTDLDALGSTITNGSTTNVRLNSAAGSGDITLGSTTTAINTLLQNTTTAATIDTTARTLQTTGIMIGDGKESLTIGLPAGTGSLQAATAAGDLVLNNASNYSGANPGKTLTVNVPIILNGASTLTTGGNVTLNGVNTYTGATFVNAGTLTIAGSGGLSGSSAITIAQGATLNYTSTANQALGTTSGFGNFIWNPSNGTAILTATRGATPAVFTIKSGIISGIVGNLGTGPASDLILDGGIIRTKDGGGGADQTSRLFTLGAGGGTIQIDDLTVPGSTTRPTEFTGTGAIAFTGSGARTLKFESAIMNVSKFSPALGDGSGGATNVIMGGTAGAYGVWALDGANTYTGTTTVNGGHLSIRKTQSVNGGVAYFTPANITVTPGAGVAGIAIGVGAGPTYFDSTAITTILDSSHLGASTTTTGLKVGAQFGLDTTAGDFTYAGTLADFTAGDSNVFNLAKHGVGTLTLTGNNTYTGTTTIYGSGIGHSTGTSILRAGSATAFGQPTTANIVFDQGAFSLINKLQLFGNNVTVIGLNSPVMNHRDGSGQNIIESGSSDTSGTGTDILTINNTTTSTWNNASGGNGPISRIQDGSTRRLGITKSGAGTLELGGTNTYTGGTIINAGVLRLLNTQALGGAAGAAGTVTFGAGSTGTLRLNANSITIANLDTNATVGTPVVENGTAGNATLTVSNTANSTFAGVLQNGAAGTLLLTKTAAGTLTLSGDNTYTGATAVNGGKLVLSGNNTTATGDIAVNSGGIVQFNGTSSINGGAYNVANRDVTINAGGTAVFGPSFGAGIADVQTALTNRIVAASAGAIAADNYASSNFDFSTAGLTTASLGAVGSVNYTGTLTPNGGTYRLGGGGGTLTYPTIITGSALTVTGASTGSVVLSNNGNTLSTLTVSSGVLDLNATTGQTATSVAISGGTIQNGTITGTTYTVTGGTITASLGGSGAFGTASGTPTLNANNSSFGGAINITGGTLRAVDSRSLGTNTLTLNGGNLSLASDGTGTGLGNSKLENISYGNAVTVSANQSITVGQFTAGVGTLNAANKTLQLGALGITAQTLTVTNNNGFGLEFTGTTTLSGAPTFNISGGSNAPVVQGLTLSGNVTGAFGITTNGAGTLVLTNSTNDFVGNITIGTAAGRVSVTSDSALGNVSNQISLNFAGAGLQLAVDGAGNGLAANIFAHQINTTTAGGVIDVPQFGTTTPGTTNIATLTTAFNGGAANAIAFGKSNNGILNISVDNTANYTGVITVNGGAIRVSNAGALGAAANNTVVANNIGAAVQINGVNTAETFNISNSGINSGGAIENFSGTNDLTGLITLGSAATIGSTTGTLNIKGGIAATTLALTYAGAGNITISNTAITGTTATQTKIGAGTLTIQNADPLTGVIAVNAGTLALSSNGSTNGTLVGGGMTVTNGATLTLDNATTSTNDRLGGNAKAIALGGATLNFTGNGATLERIAGLTLNAGLSVINTNTSGTLSFTAQTARNVGGVVNIVSGGTSSVQFTTTLPTLTPATTGILPGWFVGNDFAQVTALNSAVAAFSGYTNGDLGTVVAATGTFKPSGAQTSINTKTINALNLTGVIGATINAGQTLTLTSGGLINSGTGNISGGFLSPTVELIANYAADSSISSIITGGQAFTKIGAGNLTLSGANTYTGTTTINQGTLTLSGGNNTLAVNKVMVLNNGGTLALGSNSQYVGSLTSTGLVEGSGGNVTGTGTLTTNATNGTFAGNLGSDGGALNFIKAGANTMSLVTANSTAGTISVIGGGITLKDGGTLLGVNNTGGIAIKGATLTIDNTGTKNIADRVKDTAPITMNTGTITYNGRAQFNSTETLGDVTLNTGANMFAAVVGGTGVNSAQLNLTSLTRNAGATMFLSQTNLGQIGNSSRIVVTGTQTGLTPINGVVPGVFYMMNSDNYFFTGYTSGLGFGQIGTAGFAATTATFTGAGATDNVLSPATAAVVANQTINALSRANLTFSNGTATGGTDLLTIASGMTITGRNDWGTTTQRGRITSGTNEFFIFKTDANVSPDPTVNTTIVDKNGSIAVNPTDKVSLVVLATHQDRGPYVILTAPNTYSGGTFVNAGPSAAQGGIELNATAAGTVVIPAGGLTINNNAVVDMVTFAGQIDSSNTVTINGGGMLRLAGNNTLAGLVFNSNGGTTVPTVIPYNSNTLGLSNNFASFGAKTGILTITGNITSNPTNVAVTPLIDGGTLDLSGVQRTITVNAPTEFSGTNGTNLNLVAAGLNITSLLVNGGIEKAGLGVLQLSGASSTYAGATNVNNGVLLAGAANAFGSGSSPLTVANLSTTWVNLQANNVAIGSLAGGGALGGNLLATGGTLTTGGDNTSTSFGGRIISTGALTKAGTGMQTLTGNNSVSGNTIVNGGGGLTVNGAGSALVIGGQFTLGSTAAAGNSMVISGGATMSVGGSFWTGGGAGNPNNGQTGNILTVTGAGSTLTLAATYDIADRGTNNFNILSGGVVNSAFAYYSYFAEADNNSILVDGAGSVYNFAGMDMASTGGAIGNAVTVSNAGVVNTTASVFIAGNSGSNNNSGTVTGASSAWNFTSATAGSRNLSISNNAGATGNSFSVNSGGALTNANTLTVGGTTSSLNLGNGNGTSIVSAATVTLSTASARLNINSGRLTALAAGAMVSGSGEIVLNGAGFFSTAFASTITSGKISGVGSLTKEGTGTLTLTNTASNTFTGDTIITNGTLQVGTGAVTIIPSGVGNGNVVLDAGATVAGVLDMNNFDLTLNGLSGTASVVLGQVVNNGSAAVHTLTLGNNDATAAFAGLIKNNTSGTGTVALTKVGTGVQTLSGSNSYTGSTTINAGILQLGNNTATGSLNPSSAIVNNATLAFNRSNTLTQGTDFSSVVSGTGGVLQVGSGTTILNGLNTYTGPTTVRAGTLSVASLTNGSIDSGVGTSSNAAANLLLSGGTFQYTGVLASTDRLFTINGIAAGDGTTLDASGSGAINFTNAGGLAYGVANQARTLTLAGSNTGLNTLTAAIADNGSGATSLVKSGAGKWVLAGNNSYSGGTTISAGTLVVAVGSLGTGTTTIGGGTLEQGIENALSGSSLLLNAGTFNLNGYSTAVSSLSGSAGMVSNSSASTLAILTANASGNSTFSGMIQDGSGSVGLTKSGVGSLTLAGVNSYTGATTVAGGMLVVNGSIQTDVSVASGAFLGGSGTIGDAGSSTSTVGRLSGAGTISPGSITGAAAILSAYTFDPTEGLRAAFEFTSATLAGVTPVFNSLNDVLNLTSTAADPFAGSGGLTSINTIDIYFNVTSILPADRFSGGMFVNFGAGIYTDTATLIAGVQNATYTYWVKSTGSGVRTFNGVNYDSFTSNVTLGAIDASLDGLGSGYLTEFVVVPEPDTIALAGLGIAMAAWTFWKRRRISQLETGTGTVSAKRGG